MKRYFNVTGACNPESHYMVDLSRRLKAIKTLADQGAYFTINRARQYGKTTTLKALKKYLRPEYVVVSMDFQMLSHSDFSSESAFVSAFSRELLIVTEDDSVPDGIRKQLRILSSGEPSGCTLGTLFLCLSHWCRSSAKPIMLMIDEVDSAANNQVFLDFLAQLRGYYIHRDERPTFQSVILASVRDIKNMKRRLRPEDEHMENNPWNIAADFNINMSFTLEDITGMLKEYEADEQTGMNIGLMSALLYDYTSGYPFLVSRLCKLLDETITGSTECPDKASAWTKNGFMKALQLLLSEKNTLFESLTSKLNDYPDLRKLLYELLFNGKEIPYNSFNHPIEIAQMFGFIKNSNNRAVVSNRIFETVLYNLFLSEETVGNQTRRQNYHFSRRLMY